ncbi:MAG: matrixin family metalloprotease [Pseudomonadota bacterium]
MAVISGAKWGDAASGTSGGVVTWSLVGGGVSGVRSAFRLAGENPSDRTADPTSLFGYSVRDALARAFDTWSAVANIDFVRVADDGAQVGQGHGAHIRIAFGEIDGRSGTLGLAYTPGGHSLHGDIMLDVGDRGLFATRSTLVSVAAHEIGHAIGLLDTTDARELMFGFFTGFTTPQSGDIGGARSIYGPARPDGAPDAAHELRMAPAQQNLDILEGANGVHVIGTPLDNEIRGGAGRESISGGDGDDDIRGRAGRDTLEGGDGDDLLRGDQQKDRLLGGAGEDTLRGGDGDDALFGEAGGDRLSGDRGEDRLIGGAGDDMLFGGADEDRIEGGAGADTARGGAGEDDIFGGQGRDALRGDGGNDDLYGGGGRDRLFGGDGNDELTGGAGVDTITGGAGRDVFVFTAQKGLDVVTDFTPGGDRIDLDDIEAVDGFGDLTITDTRKGLEIEAGDAVIRLLGVDPEDLSASDFIF